MTTRTTRWLAAVGAMTLLPLLTLAQGTTLGERILGMEQRLIADRLVLGRYEWLETSVLSRNGSERGRTERRESALRPAVIKTAARGAVAEEIRRATALIHDYVPLDTLILHRVLQSGGWREVLGEPRRRLDLQDYLKPGDRIAIEIDQAGDRVLRMQVSTYGDTPDDAVTLTVQFASLPDGTGYAAQVTCDHPKTRVRIVNQSTGFRLVAP
jgi:hypothetical protein